MIPKVDNDLLTLEVETQPSLTYALALSSSSLSASRKSMRFQRLSVALQKPYCRTTESPQ